MNNAPQVVQQIRFALDTLGESNAHHEFEKLCLAFARTRISVNFLPATGPVSAGGDQGRDAETFWSNLGNEFPSTSVYASRIMSERVVLACTIQKTDISTKIRSDLATITGEGTPVDRIIYFTVTSLPVAKRHKLIAEARAEYNVELDVFDALALADQLSDYELFWVAAEYLHLPQSLAPQPPTSEAELPEWYVRDREVWRIRTPGQTMGDLISVRDLLRYATFHEEALGDIGLWLGKMREMTTANMAVDVRLRADYEVAVASLRGTGRLVPADALVREFFADITAIQDDLPLLEDAALLLQYGYGARLRGHTGIAMRELDEWYAALRARVAELLVEAFPNARALLLAVEARLALFVAYPEDLPDAVDGLISPQQSVQQVLAAYERDELPPFMPREVPLRHIDDGMRAIAELLSHLPNAPAFPIEHVAELFAMYTLSLAGHPQYDLVRDGLDEAVARIEGDSAKSTRAKRRAEQFLEANQTLRALAEVHEAKVGWWHGETLDESIPMMLLAARIYDHLGLYFASMSR